METIEIKVEGMTCGGCENSVANALKRLEGVRDVTADHRTGSVVISADAAPDERALEEAVADAGYDLAP